jgi:hypothetical protein
VPERIRIIVPSQDVAARLAAVLDACNVRVADDDGAWAVEVACDREYNELLLRVLDGAQAYLDGDPASTLRLEVGGRSYALHPRSGDGQPNPV